MVTHDMHPSNPVSQRPLRISELPTCLPRSPRSRHFLRAWLTTPGVPKPRCRARNSGAHSGISGVHPHPNTTPDLTFPVTCDHNGTVLS